MTLTYITRVAFGRARPSGGLVTDPEWIGFRNETINPAFPDGFTVIDGRGGWRDAATGETISEPTTILEVAHDGSEEVLRAIRMVAGSYKIIFGQDAVMVSTAAANVEFI
ncbi:DUF3574 domain-containing protein [Croceicoccus naphthovorans]|uniref:DUF3574 domain-containing protein n=1 Tax=Croceicoccus naphthovorans TaxID=1348774 RepID=UPI000AC07B32|nr:DUF3574 domain-containing protein [Croceicoccus naphthovorans]MBB3990300.1 hypothetical protein [Croceicoccus naphthovorans]